ncbi:hypothetical protein GCM10011321_20800 [Youhaiella tibetensis]|uniref:DUF2163 domain-containing protein n=1 Tax=Paradevosia tibetensis TaxID=1447062 RepID=A0A5B9DMC6_9HYPH|nr:DUF2163 domain-containing protein [Youhaiella tibetensis]QEE19859.1 DUF2163 domain-containing protein [Youhaiella tibetensis]GGF29261.1 hypothetical protein GCM10011321_20800 [Youhaiella tibetensis]
MRTFEAAFASHIATGQTTLASCWRITRTDGVVLGFTDHDVTLSFEGTNFVPAHGLDAGEGTAKLGAQVDTSEVVGILHSDAIAETDILLGRFDGALVETFRVNWRDTAMRALMRRDTIGEIVREDGAFRAELRSGQQALNVPRGRIYQALCDAELGDGRCGVNLEVDAFRAAAGVAAVHDRFRLEVTGLDGFDEGWFSFGRVGWTSGSRIGKGDRIVSHARIGGADVLAFDAPVGDWVAVGDALTAFAGCDRRFSSCRGKFANAASFRGFPHIPGNDFVMRYPKSGDVLEGQALVK